MIDDAREVAMANRQHKREGRILTILGYLKLHPRQSVYSLHRELGWPIASVHSILKELEEEGHLKTETVVENNRKKILYSLRVEEDFTRDYFNARTLPLPSNMRAARNAQSKGVTVRVEMRDGSVVEVRQPIDDFVEENHLVLDLED